MTNRKQTMQIVYIVEKFPSPTEYFILNEILALEKRDFNIYILALKKPKTDTRVSGSDHLKASIIYLPEYFSARLLPAIFFKYYKENKRILTDSLCDHSLGIKTIFKNIRYLAIAQYFVKKIRKIDICHIHAHFAFYTTDVAYFVSKILKLKYSFTAHAQDIFLNKKNILKKIESASFVITCTKYNQTFLNQLTESKYLSKIHCVYHGVGVNDKHIISQHSEIFNDNKIHILSVSRLVEKKGIIYLLQAIEILINKGIKVNCTIIGDGPLKKELIKFSFRKGLSNYVEFKGTKTREEVFNYLPFADIFILPCIVAANGDRDGLPNVLIEAMIMGIPVITTNISAIPELIENEVTGLLVPEKNEAAIVDAVLKLYGDSVLYSKIVNKGKEVVMKNFNNQYSTNKMEKLFLS
jgi:colanic acid/amylovoran biosynthesis glycosyltransferase